MQSLIGWRDIGHSDLGFENSYFMYFQVGLDSIPRQLKKLEFQIYITEMD